MATEQFTQATLIDVARRFAKLFDDPESGFMTWHMICHVIFEELRDNVHAEEERQANKKS